ncbi:hypothetical protein BJ165DRAFT_1464661 [Panaeolus papilionaceus]|nr:hypothetical protein BJ165DRAFT_1464661 [Panaeolus papilionaceus]
MLLYMGETTLVVVQLGWWGVRGGGGMLGCSDTSHSFCSGNLNIIRCSSWVFAGCKCSGWSRKGCWLERLCRWG